MDKELYIIGRNEPIDIVGYAQNVPAKIDTGADSSALWASNLKMTRHGKLEFTLFDKQSPFYNGQVIRKKVASVATVQSSTGHKQVRYKVQLSVLIAGRQVLATFTLTNRSHNAYPILIGRKTLNKKFLVDVSKSSYKADNEDEPRKIVKVKKGQTLNDQFRKDPHSFHQKYHTNSQ